MSVRGRLSRLRDRIVTADAVYGTILFAALIAVSSGEQGDGIPGDQPAPMSAAARLGLAQILLVSVATLVVFWIAHVYARTIAGHGLRDGEDTRLGTAFWRAIEHSNGMLWSAVPATLVLVLGIAGIIPDAADWSLVVNVVVLGALGYQALSERRRSVPIRVLGGVLTAVLGLVIILIDIAVH